MTSETRYGWPERLGSAIPRLVAAFYEWDTRRIERAIERLKKKGTA